MISPNSFSLPHHNVSPLSQKNHKFLISKSILEKLDLSEDVAGATFMAAGSSAPELFTSLAGATRGSDVGVGTIVGSAVFNLLVIVALSAALAGQILNLDWRPLTRDSCFYALSIVGKNTGNRPEVIFKNNSSFCWIFMGRIY